MARDFFINGETLVSVKGRADSAIGTLQELGLSDTHIRVTPDFRHHELFVDSWGEVPVDVQFMGATVTIAMTLIHLDRDVLDACLIESMAGAGAGGVGALPRAGQRLGNNKDLLAAGGLGDGNNFISLNLSSPVAGKPWRFQSSFLASPPMDMPLGTHKSIVHLTWKAIPYVKDPYGNSTGSEGHVLWDHVLDT